MDTEIVIVPVLLTTEEILEEEAMIMELEVTTKLKKEVLFSLEKLPIEQNGIAYTKEHQEVLQDIQVVHLQDLVQEVSENNNCAVH